MSPTQKSRAGLGVAKGDAADLARREGRRGAPAALGEVDVVEANDVAAPVWGQRDFLAARIGVAGGIEVGGGQHGAESAKATVKNSVMRLK
jgi:hypothetical protein